MEPVNCEPSLTITVDDDQSLPTMLGVFDCDNAAMTEYCMQLLMPDLYSDAERLRCVLEYRRARATSPKMSRTLTMETMAIAARMRSATESQSSGGFGCGSDDDADDE